MPNMGVKGLDGAGMTETIENPILNSPYERPDRYYEIGPNGPTGMIRGGGGQASRSFRSRLKEGQAGQGRFRADSV
jgi:type III restriction enzyme